MTTELNRIAGAYATLTFATYEPLIVNWYSGLSIQALADLFVKRSEPKRDAAKKAAGAGLARLEPFLQSTALGSAEKPALRDSPMFEMYPSLSVTDRFVFPGGLVSDPANPKRVLAAPPLVFGAGAPHSMGRIDNRAVTQSMTSSIGRQVAEWLKRHNTEIPMSELMKIAERVSRIELGKVGNRPPKNIFLPIDRPREFLSPIGIAHFYRQLYFYTGEGVGPIEQAFTVAPLETLEIVTESVRRQSHEEIYEQGSETVSESAVESRNTDDISDKVAGMIQKDMSFGMSASANFSAGGSVGVYNISGGGGTSLNSSYVTSSQTSSETARRTLKELTNRAAERITKTFSIRLRDTSDYSTTNTLRRVIRNEGSAPVSYGLRRVYSRLRVKVQDVGPRLVWQLYVSRPGSALARSRFVHFMESQPIAPSADAPAVRPYPTGGLDGGTATAQIKPNRDVPPGDRMRYTVQLAIPLSPDRVISAVSIESISDLENLGKTDYAPAPTGASAGGVIENGHYVVQLGVHPGNAMSVSVNYQYRYEPSEAALREWQAEHDSALSKLRDQEAADRQKALQEQFNRHKQLIGEKSRIRSRPSADLRKEERYEILNRMISHLFTPTGSANGSPGAPAPLEIELFHRYFDLDGMFHYMHPSWWTPRYAGRDTGFGRREYEITAESEPARLGRSLGWIIQLDGDDRRNEFINSPWVRVCLPIKPGREEQAVDWLAAHVEGRIGYDKAAQPLKGLLAEIADFRADEKSVMASGPDYVDAGTIVVSAATGAPSGPLGPADVYPVIDEFDVTVPTEGFVYDDLVVKIP